MFTQKSLRLLRNHVNTKKKHIIIKFSSQSEFSICVKKEMLIVIMYTFMSELGLIFRIKSFSSMKCMSSDYVLLNGLVKCDGLQILSLSWPSNEEI